MALLAKGALLGALSALFAVLAAKALLLEFALPLRGLLGLVFAFPPPVLGPGTLTAWADALSGRAVRVTGAEALASRRAGWSRARVLWCGRRDFGAGDLRSFRTR